MIGQRDVELEVGIDMDAFRQDVSTLSDEFSGAIQDLAGGHGSVDQLSQRFERINNTITGMAKNLEGVDRLEEKAYRRAEKVVRLKQQSASRGGRGTDSVLEDFVRDVDTHGANGDKVLEDFATQAQQDRAERDQKEREIQNKRRDEESQRSSGAAMRYATAGVHAIGGMARAGFSDQSVLSGVGGAAYWLGPEGALAGASLQAVAGELGIAQSSRERRRRLWQSGGLGAVGIDKQLTHGGTSQDMNGDLLAEYGVTPGESGGLEKQLYKGTGGAVGLDEAVKAEGGYNAGGNVVQMLTAAKRAGGQGDRQDVIDTLSMAFAQGLEDGRMGEAFDLMAQAAQKTVSGDFDSQAAAQAAAFVGAMGDAFKGTSPAAQTMTGAMSTFFGQKTGLGGAVNLMAGARAGMSYGEVGYAQAAGPNTPEGKRLQQASVAMAAEMAEGAGWSQMTESQKQEYASIFGPQVGMNPVEFRRMIDQQIATPLGSAHLDGGEALLDKKPGTFLSKTPRAERRSEAIGDVVGGLWNSVTSMFGGTGAPTDGRKKASVTTAPGAATLPAAVKKPYNYLEDPGTPDPADPANNMGAEYEYTHVPDLTQARQDDSDDDELGTRDEFLGPGGGARLRAMRKIRKEIRDGVKVTPLDTQAEGGSPREVHITVSVHDNRVTVGRANTRPKGAPGAVYGFRQET